MSIFEVVLMVEVGIIALCNLLGAIPPPAMILLGVILLIIGVFVARQILWPIGGILVIVGVILAVVNGGLVYY